MIVNSANSIAPVFLNHETVLLSENRFVLSFPDLPNGTGVFRYVLDLFMVAVDYEFQATEQTEDIICLLDAMPFSKQVFFPLEAILSQADKLKASFPDFNALEPGLLSPQPMVRIGFYLRQYRDGLQSNQFLAPEYTVLKAGLSDVDFRKYGQDFFSQYLNERPIFLTFQPNNKIIAPHQPDVLNFLTNFDVPEQIRSMARRHFMDGTTDDVELGTITNPTKNRVYQIPCGMVQLEPLSHPPKPMEAYEIYLVDPDGKRLSEAKAFYPRYSQEDAPILVFENGLGGYDTLCCFGDMMQEYRFQNDSVSLASNPDRSGADTDREYQTEITLRTGDYPPGWMPYFGRLLMAKDVWLLLADGRKLPLLHNTDTAAFQDETDPQYSLEIKFKTDRFQPQFSLLR